MLASDGIQTHNVKKTKNFCPFILIYNYGIRIRIQQFSTDSNWEKTPVFDREVTIWPSLSLQQLEYKVENYLSDLEWRFMLWEKSETGFWILFSLLHDLTFNVVAFSVGFCVKRHFTIQKKTKTKKQKPLQYSSFFYELSSKEPAASVCYWSTD